MYLSKQADCVMDYILKAIDDILQDTDNTEMLRELASFKDDAYANDPTLINVGFIAQGVLADRQHVEDMKVDVLISDAAQMSWNPVVAAISNAHTHKDDWESTRWLGILYNRLSELQREKLSRPLDK